MRPDRRTLILLGVGAVLWTAALAFLLGSEQNGLIDLRVYRTGGSAWLRGHDLYDPAFPYGLGPDLPFTYPPISAVLFAALTVLPWWLAVAVVIGGSLAALAWACRIAARRLGEQHRPAGWAALLAVGAVAAAPLTEPVRETISFGQVNMVLAGLIAADCLLRRTPWPRGALIGVAAAVKLTPAAFALYFVARRQWRPAFVMVAAFAAVGLLGWALAPGDTRAYWFGVLLDPARIGGLEFTSNQSLRGLVARFGLPDGVESVAWLGLSALVGVLALYGVAALRRHGDDVAALLVTATAALLVSPVSWSHHWVWVVLGLLWLADRARRLRTRSSYAVLTVVLLVFATAPHWWLPYRGGAELEWNPAQHLLGNAYVWCGLATVLAAAVYAYRRRGADPDETGPYPAERPNLPSPSIG
ncbi:MAG TPA: glycosyltransferase 87 family protein [Pseudonocardiaceae bacterium]